jgi:hypothetical protein
MNECDGLLCKTCKYFGLVDGHVTDTKTGNKIAESGRCRRHYPILKGFPVTSSIDWCGDHSAAKENNLLKIIAKILDLILDH